MRAAGSRFFKAGYVTLVYAFFYVPLFVVFLYSFNYNKYTTNWSGFPFAGMRRCSAIPPFWTRP